MEIQLNDKYRLKTIDYNNWALQRFGVSKTGKELWRSFCYYADLRSALRRALDSPEMMMDMETKEDHMKWLEHIDSLFNKYSND